MHIDTIQERLEELAYKITDNFCYSCYEMVRGAACVFRVGSGEP